MHVCGFSSFSYETTARDFKVGLVWAAIVHLHVTHTGVFILMIYYVIIMKVVASCCIACEALLQFIPIHKEVTACMLVEAILQFVTIHIRKYVLCTVQ